MGTRMRLATIPTQPMTNENHRLCRTVFKRAELLQSSVLAVVSAPHRPEAFEAARFAIDALKASAPIWKHEEWADGADWGTGAHAPVAPQAVPTVSSEVRT